MAWTFRARAWATCSAATWSWGFRASAWAIACWRVRHSRSWRASADPGVVVSAFAPTQSGLSVRSSESAGPRPRATESAAAPRGTWALATVAPPSQKARRTTVRVRTGMDAPSTVEAARPEWARERHAERSVGGARELVGRWVVKCGVASSAAAHSCRTTPSAFERDGGRLRGAGREDGGLAEGAGRLVVDRRRERFPRRADGGDRIGRCGAGGCSAPLATPRASGRARRSSRSRRPNGIG